MSFSKPKHYDKRLYSVPDYEKLAATKFHRFADRYFNSGANDEISLNEQYDAYKDIKLK